MFRRDFLKAAPLAAIPAATITAPAPTVLGPNPRLFERIISSGGDDDEAVQLAAAAMHIADISWIWEGGGIPRIEVEYTTSSDHLLRSPPAGSWPELVSIARATVKSLPILCVRVFGEPSAVEMRVTYLGKGRR